MIDVTLLSDDDLIQLSCELDLSISLIGKIESNRAALAVETQLAKQLADTWKAAAESAVDPAIRDLAGGPYTNDRIATFANKLGVKLKRPLTARQLKIAEGRIKKVYQLVQQETSREVKARLSFELVDGRAVSTIGRIQRMWIGQFYSEQLDARVRGVASEVLVRQGLGHQQAARELSRVLGREFGYIPGGTTGLAAEIPARYAGNPDFYFRQVASVSGHQARAFGRINGFAKVGVITYQLSNPMDRRTGQQCQQMHGQVFTVQQATKHMEALGDAKTPEEVQQIQPWLSGKETTAAIRGAERGGETARDRLAAHGAVLPPFHPLCRTDVVIKEAAPAAPTPAAPARPKPKPKPKPAPPRRPRPRVPLRTPKRLPPNADPTKMSVSEANELWDIDLMDVEFIKAAQLKEFRKAAQLAWSDITKAVEKLDRAWNAASGARRRELNKVIVRFKELRTKLRTQDIVAGDLQIFYKKAGKRVKDRIAKWDPEMRQAIDKYFPEAVANVMAEANFTVQQAQKLARQNWVGVCRAWGPRPYVKAVKRLKRNASAYHGRAESLPEVTAHETGHAIDLNPKLLDSGLSRLFKKLPYERVSWYGDTDVAEDVAESVGLGLVPTTFKGKLLRRAPIRMRIISALFRDDASFRKGAKIIHLFRRNLLKPDAAIEALKKL